MFNGEEMKYISIITFLGLHLCVFANNSPDTTFSNSKDTIKVTNSDNKLMYEVTRENPEDSFFGFHTFEGSLHSSALTYKRVHSLFDLLCTMNTPLYRQFATYYVDLFLKDGQQKVKMADITSIFNNCYQAILPSKKDAINKDSYKQYIKNIYKILLQYNGKQVNLKYGWDKDKMSASAWGKFKAKLSSTKKSFFGLNKSLRISSNKFINNMTKALQEKDWAPNPQFIWKTLNEFSYYEQALGMLEKINSDEDWIDERLGKIKKLKEEFFKKLFSLKPTK